MIRNKNRVPLHKISNTNKNCLGRDGERRPVSLAPAYVEVPERCRKRSLVRDRREILVWSSEEHAGHT